MSSIFPNPAACVTSLAPTLCSEALPTGRQCEVHISLFGQPAFHHGMDSVYPDFNHTRLTYTHFTPPERDLLHTKGFCGASGEATARGVNLYAHMVAAC